MTDEAQVTHSEEAGDPVETPTLRGFNPTNNPVVDEIKRRTDELIEYIEANVEPGRRRSVAITQYEGAAMWGVKSVFHR